MGGGIKNVVSSVGRGVSGVLTLGGSEIARNNLPASNPLNQVLQAPGTIFTGGMSRPEGKQGAADLPGFNGGQDPTTLLAQTGGASLLANIAMGVAPQDALAGYFGKSTKDGSWDQFKSTLNQKDLDALNSVNDQVTTIQSTRDLRQQAVDKVMQDFPNLAKNAAQARQDAGGEFDDATKGAMQQALGQTAAKYAANGGISSGAANEAFARVGNDNALSKLNYMDQRGQNQYQMDSQVMNSRLGEVNALRDFQNTMLQGQVGQGFSAQQANLQRQFQGQMQQSDMANQRQIANQNSSNGMFNALGSLAGTAAGAYFGGPLGAGLGGSVGGSGFGSNPKLNLDTSYRRTY